MGVPQISTGDLVRDEIKAGSPLAAQMREITSSGKLLPDEMVLTLLRQRLESGAAAGERGCMLDGYPRTLAQAVRLTGLGFVCGVLPKPAPRGGAGCSHRVLNPCILHPASEPRYPNLRRSC